MSDIYPTALPSDFDFALPMALAAGVTNTEIRCQPINGSTFQQQSVIQIELPCGRPGQYLDPNTTALKFKSTFTHAGVAGTDYSWLLGSAYSYFLKQDVFSGSNVLESIYEAGVDANMLFNLQLNDADKRGLSPALGFGHSNVANYTTTPSAYVSSATAAHRINFAASGEEALTFSYSIPLMGILGCQTQKMIPIGKMNNLRLEMTVDQYSLFTAALTANTITGMTISDVELVFNSVILPADQQAMIDRANPSKIRIRSQSYKQANAPIAASTGAGSADLNVGIRVTSLKAMYLACSPSNANEKKYAGVNPNLTGSTAYVIGGVTFPQRGLDPSNAPADAFMSTQKALGALSNSTFNGCISRTAYSSSSTAYGLGTAYNTTIANIVVDPNQFFLGVDLEMVGGGRTTSLLSGINVQTTALLFRAQIGSTLSAYQHSCNFFAFYDVILEIDCDTRLTSVKF